MRVPVISLFTGAGGLDIGVGAAGGEVRVCVEPDRDCNLTLALNGPRYFPQARLIPDRIENVSTSALLEAARIRRGQRFAVVGGPPCQPFSKSSYWLKDRRKGLRDGRAALLCEFARVVCESRATAFLFENVASLLHPRHREAFDRLMSQFAEAGYSCTHEIVNAAEYGVPQKRRRVIVLGLRGGIPPTFPLKTHWSGGSVMARQGGPRLPAETARRAIGHLNVRRLAEAGEMPSGKWAKHLRDIPPGMNYKFHTAWAGHPKPTFVAETRYWSFLLKMHPHEPAATLQASPGPWTGPFHWTSRRLRSGELAALQTFPPDYAFAGSRRSVVRQIGNAVPPLLAARMIAHLVGQAARS